MYLHTDSFIQPDKKHRCELTTAPKKYSTVAIVASLMLTISGCSSVMCHTGTDTGYYPGTRAAADLITNGDNEWPIRSLAVIDLPFSALLDTMLLPWDYLRHNNTVAADSP